MLRIEEKKQRQKLMIAALVVVLIITAFVLFGGSLRRTVIPPQPDRASAETDLILNQKIDFEFLASGDFTVLNGIGEIKLPDVYGKRNPFK